MDITGFKTVVSLYIYIIIGCNNFLCTFIVFEDENRIVALGVNLATSSVRCQPGQYRNGTVCGMIETTLLPFLKVSDNVLFFSQLF